MTFPLIWTCFDPVTINNNLQYITDCFSISNTLCDIRDQFAREFNRGSRPSSRTSGYEQSPIQPVDQTHQSQHYYDQSMYDQYSYDQSGYHQGYYQQPGISLIMFFTVSVLIQFKMHIFSGFLCILASRKKVLNFFWKH